MTLTIGRIGVAAADGGDGVDFDGPETVVHAGRQVTVTGHVYDHTREQLVWRHKQILGLNDRDEPVVPCTFSEAPELDGYYRIVDAASTIVQTGTATADGYATWSITLEQIANYRQPQIEVASTFGLLDNDRSITTFTSLQAYPGGAAAIKAPFTADANGSRSVGDGSGQAVVWLSDSGTDVADSGVGSFVVAPDGYYVGSCRVEHDLGSSTFRHAVGRPDFPSAGGTGSDEGVIRLQNGLVRSTITYSNASVSEWLIDWWDGSQWDTATEFALVGFGDHGELTYHSPSILRNTAEQCSIRFRVIGSSLAEGLTHVDFTMRRGIRWVMCRVIGDKAPLNGWRLQFASSTASTSITGGIRRTSNNAGGNRELLASAANATADTTNGRLTAASSTSEIFGVGCEVGGSSATGRNTAAEQMEEFFCVMSERAIVVAN